MYITKGLTYGDTVEVIRHGLPTLVGTVRDIRLGYNYNVTYVIVKTPERDHAIEATAPGKILKLEDTMETVTLTGKTAKGRQRVQREGDTWEVLATQDTVLFTSEPGPWLLVRHLDDLRWVHLTNDTNFIVTEDDNV